MKLSELQSQQTVKYRTGRDVGGDSIEPGWSEWKQGVLYIHRRDTDLPKKYRRGKVDSDKWKAGYILTLAVPDWGAEYSQHDYCGKGVFLAEDWYLEIEGLEP